jgi:hypothetical protein
MSRHASLRSGTTPVEKCIRQRRDGGYVVRVHVTGFDRELPASTLEEARATRQLLRDEAEGKGLITHRGAHAGRPDWHVTPDGTLHRDLPPARRGRRRRNGATERDLILRMTPRMKELMSPGDLAEAKNDTSRASVAMGIGQLLLRRAQLGGEGANYLVFPHAPHRDIELALSSLGIGVIAEVY